MDEAKWSRAALAGVILGLLLSQGCVAPDQGHTINGVVMIAPPAPLVESVPPAPHADDVWLPGYWDWIDNRHEWISGHWERPRPGRHWVADRWVRQGDGWRRHPGHWERG